MGTLFIENLAVNPMRKVYEIAVSAETKAEAAHNILEKHSKELSSLWKINRQHDIMLENHNVVMKCISKSVDGLSESISLNSKTTASNTSTLRDFKVMAAAAVGMGMAFIGFVVFTGGTIMHWW